MLTVLTLLVILSYIDRTVLNLLVEPIKSDLHLTDTQLSHIIGTAFALFYGLAAIPAGHLLDYFPRRRILVCAVLLWTSMTFGAGFTTSFAFLLFFRSGVGIGEATLAPGAYSLIGDSFSGRSRVRAFAVFSLGNAIGTGASLVIIGFLLKWLNSRPFDGFPLLGMLAPWQLVLVILGAIGAPMAFLALSFPEPQRRGGGQDQARLGVALRYLRSQWKFYLPFYIALLLQGAAQFGMFAWIPAMISRTWGLMPSQVGQIYGSLQIPSALFGLLVAEYVFGRVAKANRYDTLGLMCGIIFIVLAAAIALAPHTSTQTSMWVLLAFIQFLVAVASVAFPIILSQMTPGRLLGKLSALSFIIISALGTTVGTTLIAWISDHFFVGKVALGFGISIGAGTLFALAGLLYIFISPKIQKFHSSRQD